MNRWITVLLAAVLVAGCNNDKDATPKQPEKAPVKAADSAKAAAPAIVYTEGVVKGRIVVAGTAKGVEGLAKGTVPAHTITKIGYAPDGKTVIFEADPKDTKLEEALIAEFNKRHKK